MIVSREGEYLDSMITLANLPRKPNYTTGEVGKILGLHINSVANMCDSYEPSGEANVNQHGLMSYRTLGGDRRIPYLELIKWLEHNNSYDRNNGLR